MLTAVVALYLLATLVVGAVLSTRIKRVSDYLVAGRPTALLVRSSGWAL